MLLLLAGLVGCGSESPPASDPTPPAVLRVRLEAAGQDVDADGVILSVNGTRDQTVVPTGSPAVFSLVEGDHVLRVGDIAGNCTAEAALIAVRLSADAPTEVVVRLDCAPLPGRVEIVTTVEGEDPDLGGYRLLVDGAPDVAIPLRGTTEVYPIPGGLRAITLGEVAGNCTVVNGATRMLAVSGSVTPSIAFHVVCAHTPKLAFATSVAPNYGLMTINPDGTGRFVVNGSWAFPSSPSWSPDGTRIAFDSQNQRTLIVNADGTGLVEFTVGGQRVFDPAWSPDGERLVVARYVDGAPAIANGATEIVSARLDGSDVRVLSSGGFHDDSPAWSPDGSRVAFVRTFVDYARHVVIIHADGTPERVLIGGPNDREPAWSPDGAWIAFTGSGPTGERGLFLVRPDGTDRHELVSPRGRRWAYSPTWLPDGRTLAVAGDTGLFLHDVPSGSETWIANTTWPGYGLSWRP